MSIPGPKPPNPVFDTAEVGDPTGTQTWIAGYVYEQARAERDRAIIERDGARDDRQTLRDERDRARATAVQLEQENAKLTADVQYLRSVSKNIREALNMAALALALADAAVGDTE